MGDQHVGFGTTPERLVKILNVLFASRRTTRQSAPGPVGLPCSPILLTANGGRRSIDVGIAQYDPAALGREERCIGTIRFGFQTKRPQSDMASQ